MSAALRVLLLCVAACGAQPAQDESVCLQTASETAVAKLGPSRHREATKEALGEEDQEERVVLARTLADYKETSHVMRAGNVENSERAVRQEKEQDLVRMMQKQKRDSALWEGQRLDPPAHAERVFSQAAEPAAEPAAQQGVETAAEQGVDTAADGGWMAEDGPKVFRGTIRGVPVTLDVNALAAAPVPERRLPSQKTRMLMEGASVTQQKFSAAKQEAVRKRTSAGRLSEAMQLQADLAMQCPMHCQAYAVDRIMREPHLATKMRRCISKCRTECSQVCTTEALGRRGPCMEACTGDRRPREQREPEMLVGQ